MQGSYYYNRYSSRLLSTTVGLPLVLLMLEAGKRAKAAWREKIRGDVGGEALFYACGLVFALEAVRCATCRLGLLHVTQTRTVLHERKPQ